MTAYFSTGGMSGSKVQAVDNGYTPVRNFDSDHGSGYEITPPCDRPSFTMDDRFLTHAIFDNLRLYKASAKARAKEREGESKPVIGRPPVARQALDASPVWVWSSSQTSGYDSPTEAAADLGFKLRARMSKRLHADGYVDLTMTLGMVMWLKTAPRPLCIPKSGLLSKAMSLNAEGGKN